MGAAVLVVGEDSAIALPGHVRCVGTHGRLGGSGWGSILPPLCHIHRIVKRQSAARIRRGRRQIGVERMAAVGERIRNGLRTILGEISWRPPRWFSNTTSSARRGSATVDAAVRANPRRAVLVGAGILVLLVAAV